MISLKVLKRKFFTMCQKPNYLLIKPLMFFSPLIGDRLYLKCLFPLRLDYKLNLENPETYNEKLQWLKLYYRKPILTKMVDKYEAKEYISNLIGEKHIIPTIGVWKKFEEIDFKTLPNQFVLKTTHDQGGVIICKDKNSFDLKQAKKKLNKHLKTKHYYLSREWPYKNIEPRIIAEKYMVDKSVDELVDYKFYCFDGEPKIMYISMGRQTGKVPLYFYDMNFNLLDIERPGHGALQQNIKKPEKWELMKNLARELSKGVPHVRADFYIVDSQVFAGELTLFQGGGLMPFIPQEWDYKLGSWIKLPKKIS